MASPSARFEDPATIAWKLSTGAYYKDADDLGNSPTYVPGVCYVGLAYKRREATGDDRFAVCAAQMFLSSGEGVVFPGSVRAMVSHRVPSNFTSIEEAAQNLVAMVVSEYRSQHDNEPPTELFLHAKSSFIR